MAAARSPLLRRLIDAGLAAALALFLSIPFIGLYTYESGAGLVVGQRWSWAAIAVATVFGGRLLIGLIADARAARPRPAAVSAEESDVAGINRGRRLEVILGRIALLLAVTLPFLPFSNRFIVDLGVTVLIYVMLGWGLNVVVGLAGLLDLGYVAFYAVGAYSYALFNHYFGWSFWACLPIAGLLAASFGVTLGFPVLRLRGDYLAIVTLGFGEIIRIVLNNWSHLTGGPNGIASIPRPSFFGLPFTRNPDPGQTAFHEAFGLDYSSEHRGIFLYFVILFLALMTNVLVTRLRKLPIGRAWEALREDEIACIALGINPTNVKLSAFGCGAMLGGFAGAFFATRQGFISPESFTFIESAIILAVVVLGGMGSQIGVVAAALFLVALPELGREFAQFRMLLFGLAMILVMVWRPAGLLSHRTPTARLHGAVAAGG